MSHVSKFPDYRADIFAFAFIASLFAVVNSLSLLPRSFISMLCVASCKSQRQIRSTMLKLRLHDESGTSSAGREKQTTQDKTWARTVSRLHERSESKHRTGHHLELTAAARVRTGTMPWAGRLQAVRALHARAYRLAQTFCVRLAVSIKSTSVLTYPLTQQLHF